ncbi:NAD(P)/FAD-dependent oxidoreductase [Arenicella xantha]|uniref:UDP-galactopyranose mutase n=1 Tax=Arenicella xantha TaxID=644221 RepID=A0A395JQY3_9GAMM|nr:NAD(P)/FAD-dependent oxidoreductase [Arenicella xantha]RBP52965.1 UDP-galactopyranose mutase [Arenicella xantha]
MIQKQTVVIIGAGPAGLTAAYELAIQGSEYNIIVLEADQQVGGISKTVDYKGNKIDIGGHRFFSKSDTVLNWWQHFLPLDSASSEVLTTYQKKTKKVTVDRAASEHEPKMLLRPRKSRIYYNKKFFEYPLKLSFTTLWKIGVVKSVKILFSIIYRRFKPIKNEQSLEDFYINRFGDELYKTFFKAYTQKVWGKPCCDIDAQWGRQRVQGLGLRSIVKHYLVTRFYTAGQAFMSSSTERSLSEYFLYPEEGPGQLWDKVAQACRREGVDIRCQHMVEGVLSEDWQVNKVSVVNKATNDTYELNCDLIISSMAIRDLAKSFGDGLPLEVKDIATNLEYRDFVIVGLLIDGSDLSNISSIDDNWLYIQDSSVTLGRLQLFHNWSPNMVANENHLWVGAEYFCQQGDDLWSMADNDLIQLATKELEVLGLIDASMKLDGVVVRMPKAYPSYVGTYNSLESAQAYFDRFDNLFLVGRNGMHKYNNQDHSMLTAMEAVKNILTGETGKDNIWEVNTEQDYFEK